MLGQTRLVSGTALALQIGHRKSIDLDFFGEIKIEIQELIDEIKEFAELIRIEKYSCLFYKWNKG
jgi:hypothetical protein